MWLAEFLERPAGEVLIGFALLASGCIMNWLKLPKSEDAIVSGLTLIARALVSGSRKPVPPPTNPKEIQQ